MESAGTEHRPERFDSNFKRARSGRAELLDIINAWSRAASASVRPARQVRRGRHSGGEATTNCSEVWEDAQVKHRALKREDAACLHAEAGSVDLIASPLAQMSATPATIRRAPPLIGEHTDEILGALGYSAERITELRDAKVV